MKERMKTKKNEERDRERNKQNRYVLWMCQIDEMI